MSGVLARSARRRERPALLAAAAVGSAIAGAALAALAAVPLGDSGFVLGVAGFVVSGPIVIARFVRRGAAFSIMPLVTGWFVLEFAAGGLYYARPRATGGAGVLSGYDGSYTTEAMGLAIGLAFIAWACLAVGYFGSSFMRRARRLPRPPSPTRAEFPLVIGCFLAIGWLSRAVLVQRGLYFHFSSAASEVATGASSNVIRVAAILPLVATALAGISYYRGERGRTLYLLLLVSEVAWSVPSGERSRVISLILMVLLLRYYVSGAKLPRRAVAVAGVIAVFVVFPFGAAYRDSGADFERSPSEHLAQTADTMLNRSLATSVSDGLQQTVSRFSGAASLASLMAQGRSLYPRSAGQTVDDWASGLVPRFVLPTKGDPSKVTNEFGRSYGIIAYRDHDASIAMTFVGDFFGAFGWLGLIGGFLVVGALVRGLDEYFHERRTSPAMLAVYVAIVGGLALGFESTFAVGFMQSMKELLLLLLAFAGASLFAARQTRPATG